MFDEQKNDHVECVLDALLSEYSLLDPRPGFESRILAGLDEHAARRRRKWIFGFATATAAAGLMVIFAFAPGTERSRLGELVHEPSVTIEGKHVTATLSFRAGPRLRHAGQARVNAGAQRYDVLQAINALRRNDGLVFEQADLYLSPVSQKELQLVEPRAPPPDITIEDLGVRPIEVKELTPAKSMDQKGIYDQ